MNESLSRRSQVMGARTRSHNCDHRINGVTLISGMSREKVLLSNG